MGHRLSRIVTRTGDDGTTGLGDGRRVAKESLRIEACGSVDELNCALGVVLSGDGLTPTIADTLTECQHDLFDLGGELAVPGTTSITPQHVARLEDALELLNAELPPLAEFVLPGGGSAAAACHLSRAICRRAERRCWALSRVEDVGAFVMSRVLARRDHGEVMWHRERGRSGQQSPQ